MSDEEQIENLQTLLPEEQTEVLNYSENYFKECDFKLVNDRNDAATFLPLAIKGAPCSSRSSRCVNTNSPNEDTVKITFSRANVGNEINNCTTQKEVMEDMEVNSYKEAILKEGNKNKDQVPMEEWSILSDHVRYVMHSKSEVFQKLSINSMNYR